MSSGNANGNANGNASEAAARERFSALVDGELDATPVAQACQDWRDDAASRRCWHEYQLIGDVLRSDDLASTPARDTAFLAGLRERLAAEPVVLAPQPMAAPRRPARSGRWSWMAPSAVAAGFVAVAGAVLVTRSPVPADPAASVMASNKAAPSASVPVPAAALVRQAVAVEAEPEVLVASGKLIRDARLDRYLAAHKQFAGNSALGMSSSSLLRNAAADNAGR